MAKSKGNNRSKTSKPSVKIGDLKSKNDPKGGAFDAFSKVDSQAYTIKLTDSVAPASNFSNSNLNFKK